MENQMKDYQDLLLRLRPLTEEDIRLTCLRIAADSFIGQVPRERGAPMDTHALVARAYDLREFVAGDPPQRREEKQ